jgi:cation diffusion facilitator CzcD-associated flavoprotein CzcO
MSSDHVDVLIVGAGISGIGAACHLQRECPGRTYAILEGRDDIGGTWDLFRYPGVRSDSDMHTLGYDFKPWTAEKAIADGPSIMAYLRETVAEHGVGPHIRFGHLVRAADWDSASATWTVTAERRSDGAIVTFTARFLFMCSGYYSYRKGHMPDFPGIDTYRGTLVHPQAWPDGLDHSGKRVLVIGSGATAMTVVPAMAATAAHVTMLQRTPTYVAAGPDIDRLANALRKVLPDGLAYRITRRKNVALQQMIYRRTRTKPAKVKEYLLKKVRKELPGVDIDRHFTPPYDPWDQRLCLVPNGDLFRAIREGTASVVTDRIDTFTEHGVRLVSGQQIDADIVVAATGLELVTLGEVAVSVDGAAVDFAQTWTYKGFMYSDVPNLASSFGYINASWTLRADLICRYVCRLLNHMAATSTAQCTPRLRPSDRTMTARPWIEHFSAGYMQRAMHLMPKQGDREPWINPQNYQRDRKMFAKDPVDDGVMRFTPAARPVTV